MDRHTALQFARQNYISEASLLISLGDRYDYEDEKVRLWISQQSKWYERKVK